MISNILISGEEFSKTGTTPTQWDVTVGAAIVAIFLFLVAWFIYLVAKDYARAGSTTQTDLAQPLFPTAICAPLKTNDKTDADPDPLSWRATQARMTDEEYGAHMGSMTI